MSPQCPICYPPSADEPPLEVGLQPDACPARGNHETIKRAFSYLWGLGDTTISSPTKAAAAAQARAAIDRLRTAHQALLNLCANAEQTGRLIHHEQVYQLLTADPGDAP